MKHSIGSPSGVEKLRVLSSPLSPLGKAVIIIAWPVVITLALKEFLAANQEIDLITVVAGPLILTAFSAVELPLKKVAISGTRIFVSSLVRTRDYDLRCIKAIRESGPRSPIGCGIVILRIRTQEGRSLKVRFRASKANKETVKIVEDAIEEARL